ETAQAMQARGLSPQRSGNVSARVADGMVITPSGLPFETLDAGDVVRLALDGSVVDGARKPSSEWRLHAAVYRARPEVAAVVHCHSPNATAVACTRRPIPAFHYMVAVAGGVDIPCAAYATFGTEALAAAACAALADRSACLLANHGQLATGADLAAALELAAEVETLATQYRAALAIGDVHVLSDAEMQRVLDAFRSYGQRGQDG